MTKEIHLTQGKVAIVDDDDYEWLSVWKWHYTNVGYAARDRSRTAPGGRKKIFMHREIMNAPDGFEVDHVEPEMRLDNRRQNLRNCTHAQNMKNRKKSSRNTSGYTGVYWNKGAKKWQAYIRADGKTLYLGLFENAEEAARVRDAKARELRGEFARMNFK